MQLVPPQPSGLIEKIGDEVNGGGNFIAAKDGGGDGVGVDVAVINRDDERVRGQRRVVAKRVHEGIQGDGMEKLTEMFALPLEFCGEFRREAVIADDAGSAEHPSQGGIGGGGVGEALDRLAENLRHR